MFPTQKVKGLLHERKHAVASLEQQLDKLHGEQLDLLLEKSTVSWPYFPSYWDKDSLHCTLLVGRLLHNGDHFVIITARISYTKFAKGVQNVTHLCVGMCISELESHTELCTLIVFILLKIAICKGKYCSKLVTLLLILLTVD